jgi:putative endonuclease
MATDVTKVRGRRGEQLAAEHFERLGYRVLDRNFRTRFGELDLVVATADAGTIVFCEVKTRLAGSGDWRESRDGAKRKHVRTVAAAWLAAPRDRPYGAERRYDAIGVTIDREGGLVALEHLEGAF